MFTQDQKINIDASAKLALINNLLEAFKKDNLGQKSQARFTNAWNLFAILDTLKHKVKLDLNTITFQGTGLDDASIAGVFTGTDRATYTIIIDGIGTPDTFKWKKNDGVFTPGVNITGNEQILSDGIGVSFTTTTGHSKGDTWSISVTVGEENCLFERLLDYKFKTFN